MMMFENPTAPNSNATIRPIDATDDMIQHFMFRIGESWFAVPAVAVREVTLAPDIVSVPGCHAALDGLCRQQSEFIPVISISALLHSDESNERTICDQLLTFAGSNVWAMRIAEAVGLENLDSLAAPVSGQRGAIPTGVIGTATCGDRFINILSPDHLYAQASNALEERWLQATSAGQAIPSNLEAR